MMKAFLLLCAWLPEDNRCTRFSHNWLPTHFFDTATYIIPLTTMPNIYRRTLFRAKSELPSRASPRFSFPVTPYWRAPQFLPTAKTNRLALRSEEARAERDVSVGLDERNFSLNASRKT